MGGGETEVEDAEEDEERGEVLEELEVLAELDETPDPDAAEDNVEGGEDNADDHVGVVVAIEPAVGILEKRG